MRCKLAAFLVSTLMLLSVVLVLAGSEESSAAPTNYDLNGYVYDGETSPVSPLAGVTVEIWADDATLGTKVTDGDGKFTYTGIDAEGVTKFTITVYQAPSVAYGIATGPTGMAPTADRTVWTLDFSEISHEDPVNPGDPTVFTLGDTSGKGIIVGPLSNLTGFVYDSSTWTGLAGATAYLYGNGSTQIGSADTDAKGCFKFQNIVIAGWSEITIIVKKGDVPYSIKCAEYGMTEKTTPGDGTVWAIDFTKLPKDALTSTYYIGDTNENGLVTAAASGTLTFKVLDKNDRGLSHAYVTLSNGNTVLSTGYTDADGEFTTKTISYGDGYDLVVTCNGFEKYEGKIDYNSETVDDIAVKMTPKEMITFYGMTTYHIMMFAAVITGMILVMISYTLVARKWGGMSEN